MFDETVNPGSCKLCGGQLLYLGELGKLLWLICRNCGMHFSREETDDDKREYKAKIRSTVDWKRERF